MRTIRRLDELRAQLDELRHPIGLVPTMGNLHEGHVELARRARTKSSTVVTTIFVNPTQFGPNEDFDRYPRTFDRDVAALRTAGTDILFAPPVEEVYPDGPDMPTRVCVDALANTLCGLGRPGHFDGVATVVTKLFNMVSPDLAFFGEKDWQQLTIIRRMVRDLAIPVEIIGVPTVRADDGLALSSRNQYLSADERTTAAHLYQTLIRIRERLAAGERLSEDNLDAETRALNQLGFEVEYLAIRDADSLAPPEPSTTTYRILAAARLGGARLIDNVGYDGA